MERSEFRDHLEQKPFFSDSAALLAYCETGRCAGLIAAHTVTTLSHPLAKHQSRSLARKGIVDLLRMVRVAAVDDEVLRAALLLALPDFEDAVQACAGAAAGAEYVAARNVADFSCGPLPAVTPAELVPLLAHPFLDATLPMIPRNTFCMS